MSSQVSERLVLGRTPFAVVDLETSGFSPKLHDRVLEVAIVRVAPDGSIEDEFATLVNARRDVGPTHVHGISASDIVDAPTFPDLIGDLTRRLRDIVFVAHNARFDRDFLAAEFAWAGEAFPPVPTLCTLHLSYRLHPELASHRLATCCEQEGVPHGHPHAAIQDARAVASLLACYLAEARRRGLNDLRALGCSPLRLSRSWSNVAPCGRCASRQSHPGGGEAPFLARVVRSLPSVPAAGPAMAAYFHLLDAALEDRVITGQEADALLATAKEWGLTHSDVVDAHRAYLGALIRTALADDEVSDSELRDLRAVCRLLALDKATLDEGLFGIASGAPIDASLRQTVPAPATLAGLSVCFPGTLLGRLHGAPITRAEAMRLARSAGLRVVEDVNASLDILVVVDAATPSARAAKARRLGVRIMAEPAFWRGIGVQVE